MFSKKKSLARIATLRSKREKAKKRGELLGAADFDDDGDDDDDVEDGNGGPIRVIGLAMKRMISG